MSGSRIEAKLELRSLTKAVYSDNRNVGLPPVEEAIDQDALRKDTTRWLSQSLRKKVDFCAGDGLSLLGRHLYEMVFRGEIARLFQATYKTFEAEAGRDSSATLRLEIVFHQDAEALAELPWEFLYYDKAGDGTFLSGGQHQLVLTRMIGNQKELTDQGTPRPLQILLAICTPPGLDSGVSRSDVEMIRDATDTDELARCSRKAESVTAISFLKRMDLDGKIKLTLLADPTFADLEEAVGSKPDIVHFVGHGDPGVLYMRRHADQLEDARADYQVAVSHGETPEPVAEYERVAVSKVETLFGEHRPRMVFLQACDSAAIDRETEVCTALKIAKTGVPAVVAMQYEIDAEGADKFALAFYAKLNNGGSITDAICAGRNVLAKTEGAAYAHRDFGTPVIYMHGDTVVIKAVDAGEGTSQHTQKQAMKQCPRCGYQYQFRSCPRCKLHFYCQCSKKPAGACDCERELEYPEGGYCGFCEHESEQPVWPPLTGLPGDRPQAPLPAAAAGSPAAGQDSFQRVS